MQMRRGKVGFFVSSAKVFKEAGCVVAIWQIFDKINQNSAAETCTGSAQHPPTSV